LGLQFVVASIRGGIVGGDGEGFVGKASGRKKRKANQRERERVKTCVA